jgi:hypothetical protein
VYATCLYCHTSLGQNDVVEAFPVGRRLAFDADKGRLWVVCPHCGRWNLTPLEERWEAIEDCERRFRGTILRRSTDNIGLTRLREGLELVRIGRPLRPELAAWRYSTILNRRWRYAAFIGATVGAGTVAWFGLPMLGLTGATVSIVYNIAQWAMRTRTVVRFQHPTAGKVRVSLEEMREIALYPVGDRGEWRLMIPATERHPFLSGEQAMRALGLLLPRINVVGGNRSDLAVALEHIESARNPRALFGTFAHARAGDTTHRHRILTMPRHQRLALEIVAHEDLERQAMDGELAALETAWREAEEIAAIADNLFLPANVQAFLDRHT